MSYCIERVWTKSKTTSFSNWTLWQLGNEIWELKGDTLRHFKILSRVPQGSEGKLVETLLVLPESPIPLEALCEHRVQGWQVVEQLVQNSQQPQTQPVLHNKKQRKEDVPVKPKVGGQAKPVSVNQKTPERLKLLDQESVVTERSQDSSENPTLLLQPQALWSSLSQWIPPHALHQPSLHHQAFLELSEQLTSASRNLKAPLVHLPSGQGQRLHVHITPKKAPYRAPKLLPSPKETVGSSFAI